jgi:outer membrane protein assembly factor BamB
MSRTTAKPLALLLLLGLTAVASADYRYSSLISPVEARRYGLDRAWFSQVELDPARGRITDLKYFLGSTDAYTVYEVQHQGQKKVFSEREVDAFGEAVGKEGAKQRADEYFEELKIREIFEKLKLTVDVEATARRLFIIYRDRKSTIANDKELYQSEEERTGALTRAEEKFWTDMKPVLTAEQNAKLKELLAQETEIEFNTLVIPELTLYVTTDRGVIHAIDAETGRTRWATVVGDRDHPTERVGVSEKYVAALNGSNLYLLNRSTGETAWKRQVQGVPSAGPAVTDTYVVVPTFRGNVELYEIDETRTRPKPYYSNGRALIQPIVTSLSVAWPTDRGFLYVAKASQRGIRYRVEARDTIVSQPSFTAPGKFFMASIDGDVYCVHETSGNEFWRFTTGEPISNTPVPVGEHLYVVTDKSTLFRIKHETGGEEWWTPRIKRFVAASKDRVYCLGMADRLVILDANTGGRIASIGTELLDIFYPNLQTDRIIVGSKSGILQCLRETQMKWPLLHVALEEVEEEERPEIKQEGMDGAKPEPKKPAPGQMDPFGGGGADPFGGGADPFGGGGAKPAAGGGADPFGGGGGADPFGGGGAKPAAGGQGGADPFGGGGGADPFGGAGGAKPATGGQGGNDPFGGGNDPFN